MSDRTALRLALAFIAACAGATALYAVVRLAQSLLSPEPDQARVFFSEHAGYYWRAWTAAYGGGALGFVTWIAARDLERTAKIVGRALVGAALLLVAQAFAFP